MRILLYLLTATITASTGLTKEIKISGGAAPMNNIFKRIKDVFEKKSGHSLTLIEQSPELALRDLNAGTIAVASAGLKWEDWLKLCAEKNIKIDEKKEFNKFVIGKDSVFVFVNKKSSVSKLSFEQLEKIFTGSAKNWKEFNGSDRAIKIVFSPNIAGTNKFFSKTVMGGKAFAPSVSEAKNAEDIATQIGQDENAIGFGPAGIDMSKFGVKSIETEEMSRPITMVYIGDDNNARELQRFINSKEAQDLMKR